jgi:benzoate transport
MPSSGPHAQHLTLAVGVCVVLNMFDGLDVLVISLAAPGISSEWSLTSSQLGLLFSAGLAGMVAGSLFVAPLADRLGRRAVVLACMLVVGIGMLLSTLTRDYALLVVSRLVTGVGIAGILACAVVLVAEYSSAKWRNTAIFLYTFGYSLGATSGGAAAALLLQHFNWRAAFALGTAGSFLLLPVAYWLLPESAVFLARRSSLDVSESAGGAPPGRASSGVTALWSRGSARTTSFLWAAFFFAMAGYYFVFSWTPKLLMTAGLSPEQGVSGGVLLSLGGMGGTILFAFVARTANVQWVALACLLASALFMVAFAFHANRLSLAFSIVVALGGASTSALAGFYALTPTLYGVGARASGMGWAVGIGRAGAILASLAAGVLVDHGWGAVELLCVYAATFLLACFALVGVPHSGARWTPRDVPVA